MRLVLLGSPGVGKGTQAKFIAEKWHIPHISTGDILRVAVNTESPLGKQAKQIMDEGRLVSDEIMIQLMTERLQQSDCQNGFLLDGFPRTLEQAKSLEQILTAHHTPLDLIIQIKVPETEIIKRLSGRRVHLASGRVYHVTYHPPKEPGLDDETKEPLIQRPDDHEETIRKRLAVYHQQTEPLIKFYQSNQPLPFKSLASPPIYYEIDGNQSVEAVHAALNQVLDMQPGVVRY